MKSSMDGFYGKIEGTEGRIGELDIRKMKMTQS